MKKALTFFHLCDTIRLLNRGADEQKYLYPTIWLWNLG